MKLKGMFVTMPVILILIFGAPFFSFPYLALALNTTTTNMTTISGFPSLALDNQRQFEGPESIVLKSKAKISIDGAEHSAIINASAQPSDVTSINLDNENGRLVYSVIVMKGNQTLDVKVDAVNGKVINVDNPLTGVFQESGFEDLASSGISQLAADNITKVK